jgi:hypothetical protein
MAILKYIILESAIGKFQNVEESSAKEFSQFPNFPILLSKILLSFKP